MTEDIFLARGLFEESRDELTQIQDKYIEYTKNLTSCLSSKHQEIYKKEHSVDFDKMYILLSNINDTLHELQNKTIETDELYKKYIKLKRSKK